MKTETNLHLVELSQWLSDANETVNSSRAALRQGTLNNAHAARVKYLIEEVEMLRRTLQTIKVIAGSQPHRNVSQQGYGDIEEICEVALRFR